MTSQPAAEGQEWYKVRYPQGQYGTYGRQYALAVPGEHLTMHYSLPESVIDTILSALNTQAQAEVSRRALSTIWAISHNRRGAAWEYVTGVAQAALDAPRTEGPANIAGEGEIP